VGLKLRLDRFTRPELDGVVAGDDIDDDIFDAAVSLFGTWNREPATPVCRMMGKMGRKRLCGQRKVGQWSKYAVVTSGARSAPRCNLMARCAVSSRLHI
jgi:hypothetical protein